nr:ubiquitin carboxyl-terminal hydrolase 36 [Onthophagus taurus]
MPASTLDPVNAAIRSSLSKTTSEANLDVQLAGATKKALLADIEFKPAGSYQTTVLDKLKNKYIVLKSTETQPVSAPEKMGADETLTVAKNELYPLDAVKLGWNITDWAVGAGMVNMGNTCYLNSTLQALFHVPALVNWLMSDRQHMSECAESGGLCIICAMRKTLQDSQQRNINSIRPFLIYNKLRVVCRNLIPGRQEDAHEFLRYLVEAMEKAYLSRFKNQSQFDSRTKETTPLNQILGGYLRSTVRCLQCGHVSTTFQHFQDLLLDIRKAQTVEEALDGYFSREKLDDDSYHCESCKKKVPATKQFLLERQPMVLCIQLKRFSVSNNKLTKHVQFRQRLELTKYARHKPSVPLVYRFVALVTHMGPTVGCGHYTAVAQAPCGNYYQFDDSMVRPISHQAVFNTNAYIILYELECPPFPQKANGLTTVASKTASSTTNNTSTSSSVSLDTISPSHPTKPHINGNTSNKVYGPELPPEKQKQLEKQEKVSQSSQNGAVSSSANGNSALHSSDSLELSSSDSDNESERKDTKQEKRETTQKTNNQCDNMSKSSKLVKNPVVESSPNQVTKEAKYSSNNSELVMASSVSSSTSSSQSVKKLVPYDDDESTTSSEDVQENSRICTKATGRDWKVTSTSEEVLSEGSSSWEKKNTNNRSTVNELLKMSHDGYSAPVNSWNGTRSTMDKEVKKNFYERREEDRKRSLNDSMDQGRTKYVKNSNGDKVNPGYNRVQEYHNVKNSTWNGKNNGSYRQFYNTSAKHRNKRHFHHKNNNNYHKSYRFRQ